MEMKRLIFAALAASTVMVATPALAETVNFQGTRAVECSVTGYSGTINFGNLGRNGESAGVNDNDIALFCNRPFSASVKSANGYLKLTTTDTANDSNDESDLTSTANPQFAAGVDYQVTLPLFGTHNSSEIAANSVVNLGHYAAADYSGQSVSYDTVNSTKPLLGGFYSDTVTLTLTPQGV
jgi:spore coat protein U-like protein